VVAAFNEEDCIEEKLKNSLAIDYPADRMEILIGSDGSTDATEERVSACTDPRVRLLIGPRAGKASVLNRCIADAKGDLILLSDANTWVDKAAALRLVRHFQAPEVGAVCGNLRLYNRARRDYEESAYWAYESLIKLYEGKRGVVMGANGGLYAIRRALFTPLPSSAIVDDFVIPMRMIEAGYEVRYEPTALAAEETTEDYEREFGRRCRIAAGNFQSLRLLPRLLLPSARWGAFAFWSHKLLRWCAPALLCLLLLANLFLVQRPLFRMISFAQVGFYCLAILGRVRARRGPFARAASVAYYFVVMNWALAVGFWRFLRGSQRAAWDRTERGPFSPSGV
jgi:cellulose synthase/poly-beta-1,6-N-acetylglucosamine synthase-like glycosyltransferase